MLRAPSPTARIKWAHKIYPPTTPRGTPPPKFSGSISGRVKNQVENIDRKVKERGYGHRSHTLPFLGGGTLKRRKPKKKISRKKYYKVARNASRKLIKKNKNTRKIYT